MKKQIVNVSLFQTAKVVAVMYLVVSIPFLLLFLLFSIFVGSFMQALIMCIVGPIIYAVVGFIFTAIAAFVYNIVASKIGGIEYETNDV